MEKLKIDLNIISNDAHTSAIVSGFILLDKQNKIDLKINNRINNKCNYPHSCMVEAIINNKIIVAYDLLDGYNLDKSKLTNYLSKIDFYFKRSFSRDENKKIKYGNKIVPLGMNYYVTTKGNPQDIKSMAYKIKSTIKNCIGKLNKSIYEVEEFECVPNYNIDNSPKVMFCTRLWNPNGEPYEGTIENEELINERKYINNTRVEIIRELKKMMGDNFIGGLSNTEYSRECYPELVLDDEISKKENYIKLLKKADICIGTMGLHKSIGWKTAEYVVASKAIINEKLCYEVTGNFEKEKNYLEFTTSKECIENVKTLINNPIEIYKMQKNNYIYYQKFLRPDMQVMNSLLYVMKNKY